VLYKGELVGEYIPDLVVQHQLIVDTKTIDRITDHERGQTLNYLRITALPVGIILNFKHARLEWERLVLTNEPKLEGDTKELILQSHTLFAFIRVYSWLVFQFSAFQLFRK